MSITDTSTGATREPRAVLINGTVGVGKTSVAEAIGDVLSEAQMPNAVIDVDCLRNAWPSPPNDRFNMGLALRNVASVTRNYVEAGIARLILAGVVETPDARTLLESALGMPVTLCRLFADPSVIRDRLARRHGEDRISLEWHLARAPELDSVLDSTGVNDHSFDVSRMTASETAIDIIRTLGWRVGAEEGTA